MNRLKFRSTLRILLATAALSTFSNIAQAEIFIFRSTLTSKSMIPKDFKQQSRFYLILDTVDVGNTRTVEVFKDKTYTIDTIDFDFNFAELDETNIRGRKNFITFTISDNALVLGGVGKGKTLKLKDVDGNKFEVDFSKSFRLRGTGLFFGNPVELKGISRLDSKLTGPVVNGTDQEGVDAVTDFLDGKGYSNGLDA